MDLRALFCEYFADSSVLRHDAAGTITPDAQESALTAELLERFAPGPAYYRQVAEWMSEVADALQCAHDSGVIHRDIKPGNILIGEESHSAKIADYGIARVADANTTMTSKGTLLYQAPEVARGMFCRNMWTSVSSLLSSHA